MLTNNNEKIPKDPLYFFDDSETGRVARSIDWSSHSLGPAETWPQELKTILAMMFRNQHPMFLFWGKDLIAFYNDAFMPSFGIGKHPAAMGQKAVECWQESWSIVGPQTEHVMSGGSSIWNVNYLVPFYRNGSIEEIYWTYSSSPVLDHTGQPVGVIVTCTETTQHVLSERNFKDSEERLSLALHSGNIGFWDWSITSDKLILSETLMADWGIDPQTYQGTLAEAFSCIHPDDRANVGAAIETSIHSGQRYDVEYRVIRPTGEIIWIHAKGRGYTNTNGKVERLTGITTNVTNQKLASVQLENARKDAERANKIKSAFLANMSHEIRTPLGVILGFTDLLRDPNLSQDERTQFLDTVSRNGKSLTQIIDDILDLSKVEANRLELEDIDFSFHDLLQEVSSLFTERAKSKGLDLSLKMNSNVPQRISSDPARIRQILINIIGNAVKFTSKGGIDIAVLAEPKDGQHLITIEVNDSGIGLNDEQISRLFEPFSQADNSMNRRFGGTGLGLALSRRLARALGGDIRIKQSSDVGSTFVIEFPTGPKGAVQLEETPSIQQTVKQSEIRGMKILIADDAVDNQILVKRVLEHAGVSVQTVSNGKEAVAKALVGDFDVILMDIQMPVMDGYDAARKLRSSGFTKPIVALTAHAMTEERELTAAAGCDYHVTKPINFKELLTILEGFHN